jgi:hypothetical protein
MLFTNPERFFQMPLYARIISVVGGIALAIFIICKSEEAKQQKQIETNTVNNGPISK